MAGVAGAAAVLVAILPAAAAARVGESAGAARGTVLEGDQRSNVAKTESTGADRNTVIHDQRSNSIKQS